MKKGQPSTIKNEKPGQKKLLAKNTRPGSAAVGVRQPVKGGCVKTVVLPHEDLNRLGVQTTELQQFMQ
jgi:hypothetical protein